MGRIAKTITLNPVEPAPLSFRAPSGMQTTLDVTMLQLDGSPFREDVAGQLELISRSTGRSQSYVAPASDIVNGKLRCTFLSGDLTDEQGYTLRLFGSVNGFAELIALGHVYTVATAGVQATPEDTIDNIPLVFTAGQDVQVDIALWMDAGKTTPYDLSVTTVTATLYASYGDPQALMDFTQTPIDSNEIRLTLTAAQVATLPTPCWWSLRVTTSGQVKTLAEGTVTILPEPAP
jgi:hypothetical protein